MKSFLLPIFFCVTTGLIGMYFGYTMYHPGITEHESYQNMFLAIQPELAKARSTTLAKIAIPLESLDRKGQDLLMDSIFFYNGKIHAFGECQDLIAIKLGLKHQP